MQEAVLYNHYPHVYWNAAVLSSEAGSDPEEDFKDLIAKGYMKPSIFKQKQEEELRNEFINDFQEEIEPDMIEEAFQEYLEDYLEDEEKKAVAVDRGKIATAMAALGGTIHIIPPDINNSGFGFKPIAAKNGIACGLKTVSKIGDKLINEIIEKRPYNSLNDFLQKVKISKDRVIMLILSGAFDYISEQDRLTLLKDYVYSVSDLKKKLTLQNLQMLIKYNLIDPQFDNEIRLANWIKYVRKMKYDDEYFVLDNRAYGYYLNNFDDDSKLIDSKRVVKRDKIEKYYKINIEKVKNYIKENEGTLLSKLNQILFLEQWSKYGVNSLAEGEMKSMRTYLVEHPLANVETNLHISDLEELEKREMDKPFIIKGKVIPKPKVHHILGTVINKNKLKNMITVLTPQGPIDVKVWKQTFAYYDKKIVDFVNNEKVVKQNSFFEIGTYLLLTGALQGENFILKKYKDTPVDEVIMKATLQGNHILVENKITN